MSVGSDQGGLDPVVMEIEELRDERVGYRKEVSSVSLVNFRI